MKSNHKIFALISICSFSTACTPPVDMSKFNGQYQLTECDYANLSITGYIGWKIDEVATPLNIGTFEFPVYCHEQPFLNGSNEWEWNTPVEQKVVDAWNAYLNRLATGQAEAANWCHLLVLTDDTAEDTYCAEVGLNWRTTLENFNESLAGLVLDQATVAMAGSTPDLLGNYPTYSLVRQRNGTSHVSNFQIDQYGKIHGGVADAAVELDSNALCAATLGGTLGGQLNPSINLNYTTVSYFGAANCSYSNFGSDYLTMGITLLYNVQSSHDKSKP